MIQKKLIKKRRLENKTKRKEEGNIGLQKKEKKQKQKWFKD